MTNRCQWTHLLCCCKIDYSCCMKSIKKRPREHKYCGCRLSCKQRTTIMKTCDNDRSSLEDNEVVEALDYDFDSDYVYKECLIEQPTAPFSHELPYGLHPQMAIVIQGVVDINSIRFAINFLSGRNENPDIAFHFNPRLDQLYSARNSRLDGNWGHEEGNSQYRFPFVRGQSFYIEIFLTHSEFLVAVNGLHYCAYTYRTSLLNVTDLQVVGGVKLSRVHVHSSNKYPSPLPLECSTSQHVFPLLSNGVTMHAAKVTPVYGLFQQKLDFDSEIVIYGKVRLLPFSFFINLQEGRDIWPHPEIPLHVSVRFNQGGDHVILSNAWHSNSWGKEEFIQTTFLFTPGCPFVLRIKCLHEHFVAKVDDQPLLTFKHRLPSSNIDTLLIQGDVFVYKIKVYL